MLLKLNIFLGFLSMTCILGCPELVLKPFFWAFQVSYKMIFRKYRIYIMVYHGLIGKENIGFDAKISIIL